MAFPKKKYWIEAGDIKTKLPKQHDTGMFRSLDEIVWDILKCCGWDCCNQAPGEESALTFENGLTNTGGIVKLGGAVDGSTVVGGIADLTFKTKVGASAYTAYTKTTTARQAIIASEDLTNSQLEKAKTTYVVSAGTASATTVVTNNVDSITQTFDITASNATATNTVTDGTITSSLVQTPTAITLTNSGTALSPLIVTSFPVFADNVAAAALATGSVYQTVTGELRIKV